MKKVIWDTGFGYELGYLVDKRPEIYGSVVVNLVTGIVKGELNVPCNEVFDYTKELYVKLKKQYSYERLYDC